METAKLDLASIQTIKIDISQDGHSSLLEQAYKHIYLPAFPIADEREELDFWIEKLNNRTQLTGDTYSIFLAGDNLDDPAKAFVRGMVVGIYYDDAESGMISYIALRKDTPVKGLARKLVEMDAADDFREIANLKKHNLKAIFLEVHDPKCPNKDDVMDPQKRLDIFRSWDAKEVGEDMGFSVNYIQPPVSSDKGKCDDLILIALPVENKYPTSSLTAKFITAVYESFGIIPADKDEDYCRMMSELNVPGYPGLMAA